MPASGPAKDGLRETRGFLRASLKPNNPFEVWKKEVVDSASEKTMFQLKSRTFEGLTELHSEMKTENQRFKTIYMRGFSDDVLYENRMFHTKHGIWATAMAEKWKQLPASPAPSPQRGRPKKDPGGDAEVRAAFHWMLLAKHQSIVSAWRALDPLGHGRLSFHDFCRGSKELGGLFDTRRLWEALDANQDGFVTLPEVDPELAQLLEGFLAPLAEACGSAGTAWKRHFVGGRFGRCPADRFVRVSRGLGYAGDAAAVFDALNIDRTPSGVSFKEFSMLDRWFRPLPASGWDYELLRPMRRPASVPDLGPPAG